MSYECECKIPITNRATVADRLRSLGADDHGDRHEKNWVFDTTDERLNAELKLLRLRTYTDMTGGIMTVKCPAEGEEYFKLREEHESRIEDLPAMHSALEALGYEVVWFYEKRRHRWLLKGCEIALDQIPELGAFIEVEGESEALIHEVLQALEIDAAQHLSENYRSLFAEHCRRRGEPMREMRFSEGKDV